MRDGKLTASRFESFPIAPLKDPKVVWLNFPLLKEYGFHIENGQTPELEQEVLRKLGWVALDDKVDPAMIGEARALAYSDFYGGGGLEDNVGSARAGSFDIPASQPGQRTAVQVKGIGKTPMLRSGNPSHTARSTVYEGMKDAIWGEFTARELPYGGNRLLALIQRGPGSNEILEVREAPLRLANYLPLKEGSDAADAKRTREALRTFSDSLPRPAPLAEKEIWEKLSEEKKLRAGLTEFTERVARQNGFMHVHGIFHGTNSQSNIEMNGKILDFVTATSQPGHSPIQLLDDVQAFGLNHEQTKRAMIDNPLKGIEAVNPELTELIRRAFPRGSATELGEIYEHAYRQETRRQVLERLGIPTHLIEDLIKKYPKAADELVALTKVKGRKPIDIAGINIDALKDSRLVRVTRRIHEAKDWSPGGLRARGIRSEEISAMLKAAAAADPQVSVENFRRLSSLKAKWHDRPQRYLYFEDFRTLGGWVNADFKRGVQASVKNTINSALIDSQRTVPGLAPYEVPVSIRETGEGFQKEITTYNGLTNQWSKVFYVDPAKGSASVESRLTHDAPLRPDQKLEVKRIGGETTVRVPVQSGDDGLLLGLNAMSGLVPTSNVNFLAKEETRCGTLFASLGGKGFVYADGVLVTGGNLYPLKVVRSNLGLDERSVGEMAGKKVLSVGEGYSGLLPLLRERGVNAHGLDLWYGQKNFPDNQTGRAMEKYVRANSESLVTGSATRMPLGNKMYDEVMSHMLVNNLPEETGLLYFREAMRLVKDGGKIRTGGLEAWQARRFQKLLKRDFGDKIRIEVQATPTSWKVGEQQINQDSYLMVITKQK